MATVMSAFFATFCSNAQKSLRRVAILLVKVMKTLVIGLNTLHNIQDAYCVCLPYTMLQLPNTMLEITQYVVGQLSSRTRHSVLAVAALDKSLSMVW